MYILHQVRNTIWIMHVNDKLATIACCLLNCSRPPEHSQRSDPPLCHREERPSSVHISICWVLLMSLILPQILLPLTLDPSRATKGYSCVSTLIGPNIVQIEHEGNQRCSGLHCRNGCLSRNVLRSISRLEVLWSNDIANTEATCDESYTSDSLRCSRNFGYCPLVNNDQYR